MLNAVQLKSTEESIGPDSVLKNVLGLNRALSREDVEIPRQRMTVLCHDWVRKPTLGSYSHINEREQKGVTLLHNAFKELQELLPSLKRGGEGTKIDAGGPLEHWSPRTQIEMTGLLVRNCEKNPERDTKIPFYRRSLKFFSTRKMYPFQKKTHQLALIIFIP